MSYIGLWPAEQYRVDFPLDFGQGVRGDWLTVKEEHVGLIVVHRSEDLEVCATTAYWAFKAEKVTLMNEDPVSIAPAITCSCGMHGFIKDGKWLSLS